MYKYYKAVGRKVKRKILDAVAALGLQKPKLKVLVQGSAVRARGLK